MGAAGHTSKAYVASRDWGVELNLLLIGEGYFTKVLVHNGFCSNKGITIVRNQNVETLAPGTLPHNLYALDVGKDFAKVHGKFFVVLTVSTLPSGGCRAIHGQLGSTFVGVGCGCLVQSHIVGLRHCKPWG